MQAFTRNDESAVRRNGTATDRESEGIFRATATDKESPWPCGPPKVMKTPPSVVLLDLGFFAACGDFMPPGL
jgi:hypothetical protein